MKQKQTQEEWDNIPPSIKFMIASWLFKNYGCSSFQHIGQMIHFLGDNWIDNICPKCDEDRQTYYSPENICDSLFQAIKDKIKKEDLYGQTKKMWKMQ
jgi:hypothetical protein